MKTRKRGFQKLFILIHTVTMLMTLTGCERPDITLLKENQDVRGLVRTLGWVEGKDAREALIEIGVPAVDPLIDALKKNDEDIASNAAYALGQIGDERAIEPLIAALSHRDLDVSREAAYALSHFDDPRAAAGLINFIKRVPDDTPLRYKGKELEYAKPYIYALAALGLPGLDAINESLREEYDVFLKQASQLIIEIVLREFALPVCEGKSIEVMPYQDGVPGIHRLAVTRFDGEYDENAIAYDIPVMWLALDDPRSVELVLCFDTKAEELETCRYTDGSKITRFRNTYYFSLREAASGVEIDSLELKGNPPPACPVSKDTSDYYYRVSQGDQPSLQALEDWLINYVEIKK